MHGYTLANLKTGTLPWDVTFDFPSQTTHIVNACWIPVVGFASTWHMTKAWKLLTKTSWTPQITLKQLISPCHWKNKQRNIGILAILLILQATQGEAICSFSGGSPLLKISRVTDEINTLQHQLQKGSQEKKTSLLRHAIFSISN